MRVHLLLPTLLITVAGCINDFGLETIEPKVEGGLTDTAPPDEELSLIHISEPTRPY